MFSKKTAIVCAAAAAFASSGILVSATDAAATWSTQIVRNGSDVNSTPPTITANGANGVTSSIWLGGQKTAFTTGYFDGEALSNVHEVSYTRIDSGTTSSSPYINIWVTDGAHYAIIAPHSTTTGGTEPSFGGAEPDIQGNNVNGLNLQTLGFSVYENSADADYTWMFPNAARPSSTGVLVDSSNNNAVITLADIGNLTVANPNGVSGSNWTGGTGAFKSSDGFAIMFGESQVDGQNNAVPYQLSNIAVPEPSSVAFFVGLGGLALLGRRSRRKVA